MSGALRLVLGDQLTPQLSALRDLDPEQDWVLMAEVEAETRYVPHHPKKIAFFLAAMRHFADSLRARGVRVFYIALDDPTPCASIADAVARAKIELPCARLILTAPGEWRLWDAAQRWQEDLGLAVEMRPDDQFLCSRAEFAAWAEGRKGLRMEYFYRDMRRRTGILLTAEGKPEGGAWNFDAENRGALPPEVLAPPLFRVAPDAITQSVLALVAARFSNHFGDLGGFDYAVTAAEADAAFEHFCRHALPFFGTYQDAMRQDRAPDGGDVLFHARIALYLNVGLLDPKAVCDRVEAEYRAGRVPLNAAEGFIRQILGWREYVRGLYWLHMPRYADLNFFGATRPLPGFYWSAATEMNCLRQVIDQTKRTAYAHHIQRLMITGNFALLIGAHPADVAEWYLAVLCRCGGVGGTAERTRHGAFCRRRRDGEQALCGERGLYQ
ncbi:cryptochrome/photolyase family protein [Elstera litoralis]|uniref:cryptochrome/photolyase family protein n=1 Tax=Elstera litoralis TaxID=552518 RepID=UPI000B118063